MSSSHSFEQSCLVCFALQNSCCFLERSVFKNILLLPSADVHGFWESSSALRGGRPAGWKQKPADAVAPSDPYYAEWNTTYLSVWFTNFSGGAQLVGRWTVKRRQRSEICSLMYLQAKKKKENQPQTPRCFMLFEHQTLLEGRGEVWAWNFLGIGSLTRCIGVHVSCKNRRWICVCNSSQMYELRVSEATSGEDPREKTMICLNTKICSFMRFWYSNRQQQLCCFHLIFLASAAFDFPFCLFSQDHSTASWRLIGIYTYRWTFGNTFTLMLSFRLE